MLWRPANAAGCGSSEDPSSDPGAGGGGGAGASASSSGGNTGVTGDGGKAPGGGIAGNGGIVLVKDAVNLGAAGNFAILSKSGISTVPTSAITGNIGVGPAAGTYITGFR